MDLTTSWRDEWLLDPEVAFCNHGSFGACPRRVLDVQQALREELEHDPVHFFRHRYEYLLDAARVTLAAFVGADPAGVVFVPNATTGVSTMLAALPLEPGDEILVTDHGYEACILAAERRAAASGATVVIAPVAVPVTGPDAVRDAIMARKSPRTRIAVVDHIASPTGLVFPIGDIVRTLDGIDVIVDGAHGPGQVPVNISTIGATAYAGNCHKWLCAPKGAGFLWVREDLRDDVVPLVTSHGERHRRPSRSHLHDRFDWQGTADPTATLSVPAAIATVEGMVDGGWPAVMDRNHGLALHGLRVLERLGCEPVGPDEMFGSMAAALLEMRVDPESARSRAIEMTDRLYADARVQVPIMWRRNSDRLAVRLSAHLHTSVDDFERVMAALAAG